MSSYSGWLRAIGAMVEPFAATSMIGNLARPHPARDQKDCGSLVCETAQQLMNVGLCLDVDADRGLVDDEDPDARGEPFGDADLLLVAAGEIADDLRERRRAHFQLGDDRRDTRA